MDLSSDEQKSFEVWAHENCIVWASGVHLIGSKLIGLEEAVMQALETVSVTKVLSQFLRVDCNPKINILFWVLRNDILNFSPHFSLSQSIFSCIENEKLLDLRILRFEMELICFCNVADMCPLQ